MYVFIRSFVDGKVVVEFFEGIVYAVVGYIQQTILKSGSNKKTFVEEVIDAAYC